MSQWPVIAGIGIVAGALVYILHRKRLEDAELDIVVSPYQYEGSPSEGYAESEYQAPSAENLPVDYEQEPPPGGATYESPKSAPDSGAPKKKPSALTPAPDAVDFGGPREIPTEEPAPKTQKSAVTLFENWKSSTDFSAPKIQESAPVVIPKDLGPILSPPTVPKATVIPAAVHEPVTVSADTLGTPKASLPVTRVVVPVRASTTQNVTTLGPSPKQTIIMPAADKNVPIRPGEPQVVSFIAAPVAQTAPIIARPKMAVFQAKSPLRGVYAIGADLTEAQYKALAARARVESKRREWAANQLADQIAVRQAGR